MTCSYDSMVIFDAHRKLIDLWGIYVDYSIDNQDLSVPEFIRVGNEDFEI